ncbi:hypothetical protein QE409_002787 [Klebsiella sp. SORGH_AS 1173]|nr:hypothetical protein [Klebsiella sp. SORGH_AS_1173]
MTIALELKQLKKTYPGGVQALRGIGPAGRGGGFLCPAGAERGRKIHDYRHHQFAGE